jgi:hypothetical protein
VKNLTPAEENWDHSGTTIYVRQEFESTMALIDDDRMPKLRYHKDQQLYFAGHSGGGGIAPLLHPWTDENVFQARLQSLLFGGLVAISSGKDFRVCFRSCIPTLLSPAVSDLKCRSNWKHLSLIDHLANKT